MGISFLNILFGIDIKIRIKGPGHFYFKFKKEIRRL